MAVQEPIKVLLANRHARNAIQTLFRGVGRPSAVANFNLAVDASGDEVLVKEQFVSRGLRVAALRSSSSVECADNFFSDESHIFCLVSVIVSLNDKTLAEFRGLSNFFLRIFANFFFLQLIENMIADCNNWLLPLLPAR